MNNSQPVYTEVNNCQDCYKCLRNCPVKAIRFTGDSASVIDEMCIACGRCVEICPVGAKKIRSDVDIARRLIKSSNMVILSLAPSWVSSFRDVSAGSMISAMKRLGFSVVSETALGAEMVNRITRAVLKNAGVGITISSACPSIVDLINIYYPEQASLLMPVCSPLMSHARYLKEYYGNEVKIVFAGPCISKKRESDAHPEWIDAAISFSELETWLEEEGIDFSEANEGGELFEPVEAVSGALYPVDGGMINGINCNGETDNVRFMSFSGLESVKQVMAEINTWTPDKPVFVELLACAGGCINGPGSIRKGSMAMRYSNVIDTTTDKTNRIGSGREMIYPLDISIDTIRRGDIRGRSYTSGEIAEALKAVGKQTVKDELNCGGCGYESCHEFAIAMLEGKAERNMCVSYMRRVAHDKASVLLQRMPGGVMLVDENMKIIECNANMAGMLGDDVKMIFDANPGLAGADLVKTVPFYSLVAAVLTTGKDILDRDARIKGHFLKVSVFTVHAHKIVCAIVRDLYNPEVRNDEIVTRTRSILKENLGTVQQIAYLLGENASRTETMLNSILEILKEDKENDDAAFSC